MTATPNLPPMQSAFEAWASDNGAWPKAVERDTSGYRLMQTESSWIAWQAAYQAGRDAGLEEAHSVVVARCQDASEDAEIECNPLIRASLLGKSISLDRLAEIILALKSDAKGGE